VVPDTQLATPQVRRVLEEAVRRGVVVRLDYTDRHGRPTRRDVDPVGFYGANGLWSLVGWCHLRRSGRMFRLDRVRAAVLTARARTHADLDETLGWVPEQGILPGQPVEP
jgi:proteasome accessory factor B